MSDRDDLDPNSSVVYIALSILCTNQNSIIPELLYLFSPKQILNFIKVFSGETLKVPTVDEFHRSILTALACYHILVQERSYDWFGITYELDGNSLNGIRVRLSNWLITLNDGEKDFLEKLKVFERARQEGNTETENLVKEMYK